MTVKIDIDKFKQKKKKKVVTISIDEENYLIFKKYYPKLKLSSLMDNVIEQLSKHYEENHLKSKESKEEVKGDTKEE